MDELDWIKPVKPTKLTLYNPTTEDFTTTYDINENKQPLSYTLLAGEIQTFDEPVASHLRHHLASKIAQGAKNYVPAYQQALKDVEVEV